MFANRYFAPRYYPNRYFGEGAASSAPAESSGWGSWSGFIGFLVRKRLGEL